MKTNTGTAIAGVLSFAGATLGVLLVFALCCIVVCALPFVLPLVWWRERGKRRDLRRLRAEGRILEWDEAKARVMAGNGTFVVEMSSCSPQFPGELWWVRAARESLDPDGTMPVFPMITSGLLRRSHRRHLEVHASAASWVHLRRKNHRMADEALRGLPNILADGFGRAALTGKPSDPLSCPTGDPATDAIRAARNRLLDLRDQAVNQALYEQATEIDREVKALEQQLLMESHDTMQPR